jgi:hypothetical protein
MFQHIEENNIVPECQFGFTPKKSTTHQLFRIINYIKNQLNIKNSTGMITIDVEKAFDRVWHYGLIYKLIMFKFPAHYIKIIHSFLQNRSFYVTINQKSSSIRNFFFGLPQGAVLSPILYNVYTADIPKSRHCNLALFADDTSFYTSSSLASTITSRLKTYSEILEKYFKKWKINLNHDKTEAIFFTKRLKKELPGPTINIFGKIISWTDNIRYLGINLDKRLTLGKHIEKVLLKANNCIKVLYPLVSRKSKMNVGNKLLLYKVVIRPVITYGCPVFYNIAKSHLKKLQVFQNKFLKSVLKFPPLSRTREIHNLTKVPMIDEFIEKLKTKFFENLQQQVP